jgi:hypothetical protein
MREHMIVRIVKGWIGPDFLTQTPEGKGIWDDIRFTFDPVEECDYLIMLNNQMKKDVTVTCPRENVWAIMQEPYMKGHTDWMVEGHSAFARVLTHHVPSADRKYMVSHPADPWHVQKTYDELVAGAMPPKVRKISWIAGNPTDLPGHRKRAEFLEFVRKSGSIDIDYFGRAIRFIEDKWDGLAPYKYSVVIQNSSSSDYWTDVVADSFLSWTIPIYYGCTNLEDYFPEDAFIRIDIDKPELSLRKMQSLMKEDDWNRRLPSLQKARDLILHRYQFFPHMARLIRQDTVTSGPKERVTIPAYKRSSNALIYRMMYKIRKNLKLL